MSFHTSCQDIHIVHEDGSTMLCCVARDRHGEFHHRKIRLDQHIGNTDGWFIWGGENFTDSASDVRLEMTEHGPKLVANLRTRDGGSRGLQGIMLSDKIANEDGRLRFLGA